MTKTPHTMTPLSDDYRLRRAQSARDAKRLRDLFSEVFHPEEVGVFAETMFHHQPRLEYRHWFIAEHVETGRIASAFALIPWTWEMDGVRLKVAEMGIVGTLAEHRGQGLQRALNAEFDTALMDDEYDLAVIQGIPGFYHRFGYHYAVPLENHINLPFHAVADVRDNDRFSFRLAGEDDIPFLMQEDQAYRTHVSLSAVRDEANWRYLLTHSLGTEYGSEFWILEQRDGHGRFYCRIPAQGFGRGLIVSEASEGISAEGLDHLFAFCKRKAIERDKPYIRLNVHDSSRVVRFAVGLGAQRQRSYAWQIKIPDRVRLLKTMAPVLQERIADSGFYGFSGTLRLDSFRSAVELVWERGSLVSVQQGESRVGGDSLAIAADLFPALCLGYRTWQELAYIRPDVYARSEKAALLTDVLFPSVPSWIHEQY